MTLTAKQIAWDKAKAAQRKAGPLRRATPIGPQGTRPREVTRACACGHGWKHHTEAGRCRKQCPCKNGARR